MYAVIRAGGKQYRVAPGDVIQIEKVSQSSGEDVKFEDVLAVSASQGELGKPSAAFVTGQVLEQGRADKILVFHYKRKKQYKKLNGHRQPYTSVKITGINIDGQNHTA
jgi:large subunit ribosomal protein L21